MEEALRTIIELNRDLIFFVYGLSFFILGLAIALQSRQSSRLDLARAVTWLAAFGLAHGFHEWGDYFIPIQATYLSEGTVEVLHGVRLVLLAASYSFLLEFGARLLRPHPISRLITVANIAVLAGWLLFTFIPLRSMMQGEEWYTFGDALARYALGFPGGLVSGYALRRHTKERISPLEVPHIVRRLRIVGLSLVAYGILGGLLPPPVPFFPGNLVNSEGFEAAFIVPPAVLRSLLGLFMAVFTIRALEIFDLELNRRLEAMEQAQILQAEHSRIARELHDGAIQKVYTAGLLVESLGSQLKESEPARSRLDRAVSALNDAIHDLRSNLRDLSPSPSTEPLEHRLQELTRDPRFRSFLDVSLNADLPDELELDPLRAEHIIAVVSEALSNVVRHAQADRAWVRASVQSGQLQIKVEDNGVGLPDAYKRGFGVRNMRDRARLLEGKIKLEGRDGGGTRVQLTVPVETEL